MQTEHSDMAECSPKYGWTMMPDKDRWKAEDYADHAGFVARLSDEVMTDLKPRPGERALDLGCGNGELAEFLSKLSCRVTGIDSSAGFVEAARARGIDARLSDAQEIAFNDEFDAVFSNAALHWMPRQDTLARRVFRALKAGGRFVAEMGGAGNIMQLRKAMTAALAEIGIDFAVRDPWTFPTSQEQRACLEGAGFRVARCALRDRPTLLPTDIRGWLVTFGAGILADLDPAARDRVIGRLAELCRPVFCDSAGRWTVDYVRLNFIAFKPQREPLT